MDKIEGGVLAGIPENALKLTLTRSAIKMQHSRTWRVDKSNSVHDLVICLTGSGSYMVDDSAYTLTPGDAMLIPAGSRFVGWHASGEAYTGVAQHFTLDLFGKHDLIAQMRIDRAVRFSRWPLLEPVVRYYHDIAPASSTTLLQHHLFMFILIEFLEDAFIAWNAQPVSAVGNADGISLGIMLAATRITADPLDEDIAERVVAEAPYNPDYFKREFRRQIGWTPRKFQEFKRMERAMNLLASGNTVSETAALVGYSDVYYFSRMFKRHIGTSPAGYKLAVKEGQDGKFPRGEEDGQVIYPLVERVEA
ncbi:AraC family transcriptional regulator [Chelativorans salis]|uniref:AraC family transcriptional regulator n=1 Tax=Chelativorans salis TaxID=2978478 RepID=A0ABT2LGA2_9HYPH|nr:AraC family transcriptional regulator [Chelativorans sp. EGI FJ00035]MCT7373491.1 AraC family transcriptional regulator [Chelativorans sp. EGI FJ00035]